MPSSTRRVSAATASVVFAVALVIFLSACVGRTLSRPAIIGASASSGVGAEIAPRHADISRIFDPAEAMHVDLESVLNAAILPGGMDPIMLADPSFYLEPEKVGREQLAAAAKQNATIVIGVDALFWSVYGSRFDASQSGVSRTARADCLRAACARLELFKVPILLGDLPDMSVASDKGVPGTWIPSEEDLAALNTQLREWAASRPNVVLLPVSDLVTRMHAGDFDAPQGPLIQKDNLHPTATGLAVMLYAGLEELHRRGLIERSEFVASVDELLARLPREAERVRSSRRSGKLALLGLLSTHREWLKAAEAKDCERAAELGERVFRGASRIKEPPHEFAGVAAVFSLDTYGFYCPDARRNVAQWRERLVPMVQSPMPDPWPFELWGSMNAFLDDDRRTLDRLLELKGTLKELPKAYDEIVKDTYSRTVRQSPARSAELFPSPQPLLDVFARRVKLQTEYAKKRSKDESRFKLLASSEELLAKTTDPVLREDVERRIREIKDPMLELERGLVHVGADYAELEWAYEQAGRTDATALVRSAAEEQINPERYALGKQYFAKQLEAAQPKASE